MEDGHEDEVKGVFGHVRANCCADKEPKPVAQVIKEAANRVIHHRKRLVMSFFSLKSETNLITAG